MATGALLIGRYVTMAVGQELQAQRWVIFCWWAAGFVGLTLPAVFAVDHLIRHPAITPQKLLRGYAALLIAALLITVVAAQRLHALLGLLLPFFIQIAFSLGFAVVCLTLMRKIHSPPIQRALLVLAVAYSCLALALSRLSPSLYPDIVGLAALWYAYETGSALQQNR